MHACMANLVETHTAFIVLAPAGFVVHESSRKAFFTSHFLSPWVTVAAAGFAVGSQVSRLHANL